MRGPGRKRGTWRCKHGPPPPRCTFRGRAGLPRRARSTRGALPAGRGCVCAGAWGPRPGGGPRRPGVAVVGVGGWDVGLPAAAPSSLPSTPGASRAAGPAPAHSRGEVMWGNALGGPAPSQGPGAGGGRWRPRFPSARGR